MDYEFEVEVVAALAAAEAGGESLITSRRYSVATVLPAAAEREAIARYTSEQQAGGRKPNHLLLFAQTVARVPVAAGSAA